MIVEEYIEKNKNMDTKELVGSGCPITGKVYRHSENLKNDISFLMVTEEATIEELMKIIFDDKECGIHTQ